jgi:hypothetical protein
MSWRRRPVFWVIYALAVVVVVPVILALAIAGAFGIGGLFAGMVFGALDALGLVPWDDRTVVITAAAIGLVFAVGSFIFRDRLGDW